MTDTTILQIKKLTIVTCLLLLQGACSSTPKPILEIANAKTEITEAKKFNASTLAKEELQLAEKNLQNAKDAIATGKNLSARWFAEQAISDAVYARVKATAATFSNVANKQEEILKKSNAQVEQKQNNN